MEGQVQSSHAGQSEHDDISHIIQYTIDYSHCHHIVNSTVDVCSVMDCFR